MIRRLRGRHRWMFAAVAIVTVPLLFAALAARPDLALEAELPGEVDGAVPQGGFEVELSTEPPMRVRAVPGVSGDGVLVVEAPEAVEGAGLLLYWLPSGSTEFPERAVFLGPVRGHGRQVLPLPSSAGEPGVLLLYSLGHGVEVTRVDWPGEDKS